MFTAVLRPCYVRGTKVVVNRKASEETFSSEEVIQKFFPRRPNESLDFYKRRLKSLRSLRIGSFFGTLRDPRRGLIAFILRGSEPRDNNFKHFSQKNPRFLPSIEEVYRVESIEWEASWDRD